MAKISALCCALLSCSTLIQIDVFFLLLDRNKHEVEMEMEIRSTGSNVDGTSRLDLRTNWPK